MTILIIGERSNLSKKLTQKLDNVTLLPSNDIEKMYGFLEKHRQVNIIINVFHPSVKINEVWHPDDYAENTIGSLSKILKIIIEMQSFVETVIYTSSSSVYGQSSLCKENDKVSLDSLYASLKFSSEMMIHHYLSHHKINYIIARVFNMYGGSDNFSIVSKIIQSIINKKQLNLTNNGESVRDFIHIDDVCFIYKALIKSDYTGLINIGTGQGKSIKCLIDVVQKKGHKLKIKNIYKVENSKSIASIDRLNMVVGELDFINIENYLNDCNNYFYN